jgi:hypothetical protein
MFSATSVDQAQGFSGLREQQSDSLLVSSALDLFSTQEEDRGILGSREATYRPTSEIGGSGPFSISIPMEGNLVPDLASIRTHIRIRITKTKLTDNKEENLSLNDKAGVVNNLPSAMWRLVEVYLNQKMITYTNSPMYHHKATLEKYFNYSSEAAGTVLKTCNWLKDTPGQYEYVASVDARDAAGDVPAVLAVNEIAAESAGKRIPPSMRGADAGSMRYNDILHTEVSTGQKLLPTRLDIEIKFYRNEDDVLVIKSADLSGYKINIVLKDFYVTILKYELNPAVLTDWDKKFARGLKAEFPVHRVAVKTKQISAGETYCKTDNLFRGILPYQVVVCMVSSDAFAGSPFRNPFRYQHFNCNSVQLKMNSEGRPMERLTPNFAGKDALTEYRHFFDNLGISVGTNVPDITYADYLDGLTFFCWDLTPDRCSSYHRHARPEGLVDVNLVFAKAIPRGGMTLICFGLFNDHIFIDGDRNVYTSQELLG